MNRPALDPELDETEPEYVAEYECRYCGMLFEDVDTANDHTEGFGRAHICEKVKR